MAFDVSALPAYVKQNGNKWLTNLVTGSKTAAMIQAQGNLQTGVKSASTLNILDTDAIFQTGGTCGFNASGSTTITQRQVTVGKFKVHERLCPKDLESKFTQEVLTRGSMYDEKFATRDFLDMYLNKKHARINAQLETAIWQGDVNSANVNLNKFDGFVKLINAATGTTDANTSVYVTGGPITNATGFTVANAKAIIDGIYNAIPLTILDKDDVRIFLGVDKLRILAQAYRDANLFHYTGERAMDNEVIILGTNQKVVGVPGLNGSPNIYATPMSNLYAATDLADEEEKYELFYAREADEVRFMAEWKYGVQFAFADQIVKFTLA